MFKEKYKYEVDEISVCETIGNLKARAKKLGEKQLFRSIFSLIDLTTLSVADTEGSVLEMVDKVNGFREKYEEIPNVAALCVYPNFVPVIKKNLTDKNVSIASVGAAFPSSQTFLTTKKSEVKKAIDTGADEIDIVIPVGYFLEENYDYVFKELSELRKAAGETKLKVILETAMLGDSQKIANASFLAMEAGADFIKTSTGKNSEGASAEAVLVMCECIKRFHAIHGKEVGIKPAGGISEAITAIEYYLIVNSILGDAWMNKNKFRIGASRLANKLLGENYF